MTKMLISSRVALKVIKKCPPLNVLVGAIPAPTKTDSNFQMKWKLLVTTLSL